MKKDKKKITADNHDGLIDIIINKIYEIDALATKHPVVVKKAKSLRGKTKEETIKKCFDYVHNTVSYCDDPAGTEHITSPWLLIQGKKKCEDCESMVLLLSSLLRINGIKTRYKVVSWKDPKDKRFSHIILEADNNGSWLILDPTMKSGGYGKSVTPNRQKIYASPMANLDLVTLSNNPMQTPCKCKGRCNNCRRGSKVPPINNIINIGNTSTFSNQQDLRQSLGIAPNETTLVIDEQGNKKTIPNNVNKNIGHKQLYGTVTTANGKVFKYPERY